VELTATGSPIADFRLDFDIGIGLRQSNYGSLDQVNAIVSRMKEDGTITAILERYGVPHHRPSRS
jgi:ABC-type amino acid transport substrate-binding protein